MTESRPRPLIRAARLRDRCRQLGAEIARDYAGNAPLVVPLLGGAFCFVADLVRAIPLPDLTLHFARASSYVGGTASSGTVALADLPDVDGRRLLLVDDILDTGRTLQAVTAALHAAGCSDVRTCVLLDKPARRVAPVQADYVGLCAPWSRSR
ncbi:MAG: phosphoribosyltransferase [Planctomycetota bacterium]